MPPLLHGRWAEAWRGCGTAPPSQGTSVYLVYLWAHRLCTALYVGLTGVGLNTQRPVMATPGPEFSPPPSLCPLP